MLPATVQSAIAFTAMARGNMPAAICSASASTLLGIVITPVLVGLLLPEAQHTAGSAQPDALANIGRIMLQLLVPFVAGHLLRPWIGGFVKRRAAVLKFVDQGSILLVVYTAFSAAVVEGLWQEREAIRYIQVRHEEAGALAAAADAKLNGTIGVAFASAGPG